MLTFGSSPGCWQANRAFLVTPSLSQSSMIYLSAASMACFQKPLILAVIYDSKSVYLLPDMVVCNYQTNMPSPCRE